MRPRYLVSVEDTSTYTESACVHCFHCFLRLYLRFVEPLRTWPCSSTRSQPSNLVTALRLGPVHCGCLIDTSPCPPVSCWAAQTSRDVPHRLPGLGSNADTLSGTALPPDSRHLPHSIRRCRIRIPIWDSPRSKRSALRIRIARVWGNPDWGLRPRKERQLGVAFSDPRCATGFRSATTIIATRSFPQRGPGLLRLLRRAWFAHRRGPTLPGWGTPTRRAARGLDLAAGGRASW